MSADNGVMVSPSELEWFLSFYDPEKIEMDKIQKTVDLKGKEILIIGCDAGRLITGLSGYKKMTVADSSQDFIDFWSKKIKGGNTEFVKTEPGAMQFPDASFDLIVSQSFLSKNNLGSAVWDLSRLLKPSGALVITVESGLGEYEELKERFCPGYRKMVRLNSIELKRQVSRFFSKIDQQNLIIPDVYPDMGTALKVFTFDMTICTKKCNINQEEERKELEKFAKNGKIIINRGVILLKASG